MVQGSPLLSLSEFATIGLVQVPPLVSIVTPTYNDARHISETLSSVQSQTLTEWEHLVIDDGSSDETIAILEAAALQEPRMRVFRQPENAGPAAARNCGLAAAQGRFIAFVDADDIWLPEKLEKQVAFMQQNDVVFSYTNYIKISEETAEPIGRVCCPDMVRQRDFRRYNPVGCSTVVYDRHRVGNLLMPMLRKRQDWGLWFRITELGYVGRNVGEILVHYRVRTGSVSSNKIDALRHTWRLYRDVIGMSFAERSCRLVMYAALGVQRYRRARQSLSAAAGE